LPSPPKFFTENCTAIFEPDGAADGDIQSMPARSGPASVVVVVDVVGRAGVVLLVVAPPAVVLLVVAPPGLVMVVVVVAPVHVHASQSAPHGPTPASHASPAPGSQTPSPQTLSDATMGRGCRPSLP
jgi:hypothetical protein